MGASESKPDAIDVDVDVAEAPAPPITSIGSTLSEADTSAEDAKPATPQAVYPPGSAKGTVPKFAVPLADLAAEVESDPHKVLVYKKLHGGAEYFLRFEDEDQVAPFCRAVKAAAELAALDRIKDNLGHPRPPRTDSTLYADKVGKEFASKQPEHEVTAADATELGALGVAPGVGPVYH